MVRRLKANHDQRQLGLFGAALPLGEKPKAAKVMPVRGPSVTLVPAQRIPSTPRAETIGRMPEPKRLSSLPPEIVRPSGAALLLSVSLSLLKKWRTTGDGPRFVKLGGRAIGYRRADLSDWIEGRIR
jgi:predicted DNA-binding transcriptional regulator AlpA